MQLIMVRRLLDHEKELAIDLTDEHIENMRMVYTLEGDVLKWCAMSKRELKKIGIPSSYNDNAAVRNVIDEINKERIDLLAGRGASG